MDIKDFIAGTYKKGFEYQYFMPETINHSFYWSDEVINSLLEKASLKLGELNSFSQFVPDVDIFIRMHVVKEAVFSSRIEGTKTNIEEALTDEKQVQPENKNDWDEVNNYVLAMNKAIDELKTLPLSNRLIKNTHKILLSSVRGKHKNPGEFRKSQNWIGGASLSDAVFIPPAHTELPNLLTDLELFINNSDIKIPHLVRIALAHYQFETIHPFLDGNGRVGRLLITLYLVANGILEKPLLYLSHFFEKNKSLYYDNLTLPRTKNDMGQWIKFFLTGIIETSVTSINTLKKITELKSSLENKKIILLGKRTKQALILFNELFKKPIISNIDAVTITGHSVKSANNLISTFVELGILVETTGLARNRIYVFKEYLNMF